MHTPIDAPVTQNAEEVSEFDSLGVGVKTNNLTQL